MSGCRAQTLKPKLVELRDAVAHDADLIQARWDGKVDRQEFRDSARNLAAYLALRRHDLRPLQRTLMSLGLSSLGRLESRVLVVLDAVIATLTQMSGGEGSHLDPDDFFLGEARLEHNAKELFGDTKSKREVAILVTCPSEAANDPAFMRGIIEAGANAIRINCAHDDADAWAAMIRNLRLAEKATGRRAKVFMDLGGPKCRTIEICHPPHSNKLGSNQILLLHAPGRPRDRNDFPFQAGVSLPEVLDRVEVGHRVLVDDGRYGGVVEAIENGFATLRISAYPAGGKLKAEKGLNFPDTNLGLSPLTDADLEALDFVAHHADVIDYSFVQSGDDITLLQDELRSRRPNDWAKLGLVAKIETPRAVTKLPEIIVRAAGLQSFGVMIARGDLAVEIGFARVAEMQEEILWICEAAHVPVIWATQVLESLVKKGVPARGEMTDAAMAGRAECVMLNKGPYVIDAVKILDDLMQRMAGHQDKKTPQLRALRTWQQ